MRNCLLNLYYDSTIRDVTFQKNKSTTSDDLIQGI